MAQYSSTEIFILDVYAVCHLGICIQLLARMGMDYGLSEL